MLHSQPPVAQVTLFAFKLSVLFIDETYFNFKLAHISHYQTSITSFNLLNLFSLYYIHTPIMWSVSSYTGSSFKSRIFSYIFAFPGPNTSLGTELICSLYKLVSLQVKQKKKSLFILPSISKEHGFSNSKLPCSAVLYGFRFASFTQKLRKAQFLIQEREKLELERIIWEGGDEDKRVRDISKLARWQLTEVKLEEVPPIPHSHHPCIFSSHY